MADFYLKRGDTSPSLEATLTEFDGTDDVAIDLTGASVVFSMTTMGGTVIVSRKSVAIVTALNGQVRYDWESGDTAMPGTFKAEFEVTLPSGKIVSFPNTESIVIKILEDLA